MRFRQEFTSVAGAAATCPLPLSTIREVVAATIQPAHFFVTHPLALEWQHAAAEAIPWEIYRGRLLDAAQTRLRQTFESWNVFGVESEGRTAEPILSVKLDAIHRQLQIVRAVYCFTWEGYHAGNQVYESRETCKWIRELIGTIALDDCLSAEELQDEVAALLFQAVVGCSRLPLQSVEAPLPAFSLGQLAYVYRTAAESGSPPMRSFSELIEKGLQGDLAWLEKAKLLECLLRSTALHDIEPAAERFMKRWCIMGHTVSEFVRLCRSVFNEVALSPYTGFVDNMLMFLHSLRSRGELSHGAVADFLGYLLRQTVRHLTAYDLITFHHRGANYP
ncbi:MAG TPA: hypothetical protein VKU02_08350, partial [Gemmataceae bacterium]|nr:hypothetical protein [Gemmataceae bacterium]